MKMKLLIYATFLFFFSVYAEKEEKSVSIRVRIEEGEIEGRLIKGTNGATGYGFMGIPYAQPPLGRLRFRNPIPPSHWNGTLECKNYKSNCWQIHTTLAGEHFRGIEDCLYLNVFVGTECSNETRCPVLYYIHGGGWEFDTPSVFPPELLVENFASRGLVVVTVAYRLNVFGFWTTGGEEANGNYGLHDMIAGLQWVQREIRNFGGDPGKVTIMGHSSGGMTVSLFSVSPATRGLFHQAVMMSGNTVPLYNDLSLARRVASTVGCSNETREPWRTWIGKKNRRDIVECMRKVDMEVLGTTYLNLKEKGGSLGPRNDGPDGIFPQPLDQLISNRRALPSLMGTTERENGNLLPQFANATSKTIADLCRAMVAPLGLRNERPVVLECQRRYARPSLENKTVHNESDFSFWAFQAERIISTVTYQSPCYKDASSLLRKGSRVYLYSFDYEKRGQEEIGPYHAFDLTFLIGVHPFKFDERDKEIQKIYARLFADFVKFGNPTPDPDPDPKWTPLQLPDGLFDYFSIDLPEPSMKKDFHKKDIIFWNYLVPFLGNGLDEHHIRKIDDFMKMDDAEVERSLNSLAQWHAAFWIVLAVLMAVVCTTLALFVRFSYGRARNGRRTPENESLLSSGESENSASYQTFRE